MLASPAWGVKFLEKTGNNLALLPVICADIRPSEPILKAQEPAFQPNRVWTDPDALDLKAAKFFPVQKAKKKGVTPNRATPFKSILKRIVD